MQPTTKKRRITPTDASLPETKISESEVRVIDCIKKHMDSIADQSNDSAFLLGEAYSVSGKFVRDLFYIRPDLHKYLESVEQKKTVADDKRLYTWNKDNSLWQEIRTGKQIGEGAYKKVYEALIDNSSKIKSVVCFTNDWQAKMGDGIIHKSNKLLKEKFGDKSPTCIASPPDIIYQCPSRLTKNIWSGSEVIDQTDQTNHVRHVYTRKFYEYSLDKYREKVFDSEETDEKKLELVVKTFYDQLIALNTLMENGLCAIDLSSENWFVDHERAYLGDYDMLDNISNPQITKIGDPGDYFLNARLCPNNTFETFFCEDQFIDDIHDRFKECKIEKVKTIVEDLVSFQNDFLDRVEDIPLFNLFSMQKEDIALYFYDEFNFFLENNKKVEDVSLSFMSQASYLKEYFESEGLQSIVIFLQHLINFSDDDCKKFMNSPIFDDKNPSFIGMIKSLQAFYRRYESKEHCILEWTKKKYQTVFEAHNNLIIKIQESYPDFKPY